LVKRSALVVGFSTVAAASIFAGPALALIEHVECTVTAPCATTGACPPDPIIVRFTIDRNQFASAISSDEPPRNKVTTVTIGTEQFTAEPILMAGGVRGFWKESFEGSHLLTFSVGDDAVYSRPIGQRLIGECEVSR